MTLSKLARNVLRSIAVLGLAFAMAQADPAPAQANEEYSPQELIDKGHEFFGATSGGVATAIETIFARYGVPNGYILGEEGSGAIVGGVTYGEGTLFTKNAGDHTLFWQGPSIGWDFGGQGSRTMMLVYDLGTIDEIYRRFVGVAGAAYLVAGVGFNVMRHGNVLLIPVRTGVGARLGVNIGYLKVTSRPTWNPF